MNELNKIDFNYNYFLVNDCISGIKDKIFIDNSLINNVISELIIKYTDELIILKRWI